MSWNYRVVSFPDHDFGGKPYLRICEVFYDELGGFKSYGEVAPMPSGETYAELEHELERMRNALMMPTVDVALFKRNGNEH